MFEKAQEGDKVFGLVFGEGFICTVWGKDSFYYFEVCYKNGFTVPYSEEGVPAWNSDFDFQTVFPKNEIDLMEYDITPAEGGLSPKEIIKLRDIGELEVKCPSGLWNKVCPDFVSETYLENKKFWLFRKAKEEK